MARKLLILNGMKTHHGEINILDSAGIANVFQRGRLAHLGCYAKDEMYIVPITYVFEDGYIYSHSRLGKKIQMMRKHPSICIQVEEVKNYFDWKSVIAWGHFEELTGDESARAMRLLIGNIVKNENNGHISSLEVDLKAMLEASVIYRMKIEKSTGRFEAFD